MVSYVAIIRVFESEMTSVMLTCSYFNRHEHINKTQLCARIQLSFYMMLYDLIQLSFSMMLYDLKYVNNLIKIEDIKILNDVY